MLGFFEPRRKQENSIAEAAATSGGWAGGRANGNPTLLCIRDRPSFGSCGGGVPLS